MPNAHSLGPNKYHFRIVIFCGNIVPFSSIFPLDTAIRILMLTTIVIHHIVTSTCKMYFNLNRPQIYVQLLLAKTFSWATPSFSGSIETCILVANIWRSYGGYWIGRDRQRIPWRVCPFKPDTRYLFLWTSTCRSSEPVTSHLLYCWQMVRICYIYLCSPVLTCFRFLPLLLWIVWLLRKLEDYASGTILTRVVIYNFISLIIVMQRMSSCPGDLQLIGSEMLYF